MATHRSDRRTGYDDPADAAARPTARADDEAPDRPASARVVVIAGEDVPTARYASWLADTYETQLLRRGKLMDIRPETDVVVVDRRALTMAGDSARATVGPGRRDSRVLAPASVASCGSLVDECIAEPLSRDRLLSRVEAAMLIAAYDATISELLSLTNRRRELRNCSNSTCLDHRSDIASLSERIDKLHRHIDDGLTDVESRYATLLGRGHRSSTRQETGAENA